MITHCFIYDSVTHIYYQQLLVQTYYYLITDVLLLIHADFCTIN